MFNDAIFKLLLRPCNISIESVQIFYFTLLNWDYKIVIVVYQIQSWPSFLMSTVVFDHKIKKLAMWKKWSQKVARARTIICLNRNCSLLLSFNASYTPNSDSNARAKVDKKQNSKTFFQLFRFYRYREFEYDQWNNEKWNKLLSRMLCVQLNTHLALLVFLKSQVFDI